MQTSQFMGMDLSVSRAGADLKYLYEEEFRRVRMCTKRISRLMYGRTGLVTFMHHLLALLDEDARADTLNFYSAMMDQLGRDGLEGHEAEVWWKRFGDPSSKKREANKSIAEESNEEEEEKKSMDFSPHNVEELASPATKSKDENNPMLRSNHSSSQGGIKISGMNVSMSSYSRLFK
jgi:hypothetical protein